MGDDTPFRNYYSDFRAEDKATKTFMGGLGLSTRVRLFVLLSLLCMAGLGALLYIADQRVTQTLATFEASQRLVNLVGNVSAGAKNIRTDSQNFLLTRDLRHAGSYENHSKPILADLGRLAGLPSAEDVSKHVTTVNEAVAQHVDKFDDVVEIQRVIGLDEKSGLSGIVGASVTALQSKVLETGDTELANRLAILRQAEQSILDTGDPDEIKRVETEIAAFKLAVEQLNRPAAEKTQLNRLADSYQTDIAQYGRTRAALRKQISDLNDLDSYMAPSLEALVNYGTETAAVAQAKLGIARDAIRQLVAAGSATALILVLLIGVIILRSVTVPVTGLASAATRLAHGDRTAPIPGLGNFDDIGEIANAMTFFRENIAQADRLRKELEEQAQTMQPERTPAPAPARTASADVESSQDRADRALVPAVSKGLDAFTETPITEISQQVTKSSQDASLAAYEAERTEIMINGLASALEKAADVEALMANISDQSSLLAVQTAIDGQTGQNTAQTSDENLIVLLGDLNKDSGNKTTPKPGAGQSVEQRTAEIQDSVKRVIAETRELGRILGRVNEIALEIGAEASSNALDSATDLLRQSEDLRGMLDDLLGKIRMESGTFPSTGGARPKPDPK